MKAFVATKVACWFCRVFADTRKRQGQLEGHGKKKGFGKKFAQVLPSD